MGDYKQVKQAVIEQDSKDAEQNVEIDRVDKVAADDAQLAHVDHNLDAFKRTDNKTFKYISIFWLDFGFPLSLAQKSTYSKFLR